MLSALALRHRLLPRLMATTATHARRDSMRSPRSERSHARANASCTASSAVAALPHARPTAPTSLGYSSRRNARIVVSSSSGSFDHLEDAGTPGVG